MIFRVLVLVLPPTITFTEDHLLNVLINLIIFSVDGLGRMLQRVLAQRETIQAHQEAMQAQQNVFYAHFLQCLLQSFSLDLLLVYVF